MKGEIRHICIAEDDPDDYDFFSNTLKEINSKIKLTWFQTCEDLLTYLKTEKDLPCLIVLDMNMPKMDGQTCLVSIKKELNLLNIPIIIFSTAGHPHIIREAIQAGAHKYLFKPSSLEEFKKIVCEILATPVR
jgi:response regulator RpfG family c-di-GMP phosphodiesterase